MSVAFPKVAYRVLHVVSGKVLTALFSFAIFFLIARLYPIQEVGMYVVAVSITAIVTMVANWGVNEFVFRECSSDSRQARQLLAISRKSKVILGISLGAVAVTAVNIFGNGSIDPKIFLVLLSAGLVDAQTISYIMVFRAKGETRLEMLIFPGRAALRLLVLVAIAMPGGSLLAALAGMLLVNILALAFVRKKYLLSNLAGSNSNGASLKLAGALHKATPYAISSIVGALYFNVAPVLIQSLQGAEAVAVYGVAMQVFQALLFIPVGVNIAIQPSLVRAFEKNPGNWLHWSSKVLLKTMLASLVIGMISYLLLPGLVVKVFGEQYIQSGSVLTILLFAFIIRFINASGFVALIISAKNAHLYSRFFAFSLIVNLIGNFTMVGRYGVNGAAYSLILSEIVLFALFVAWWIKTRRIIQKRQ